jgi:hypothetical protein
VRCQLAVARGCFLASVRRCWATLTLVLVMVDSVWRGDVLTQFRLQQDKSFDTSKIWKVAQNILSNQIMIVIPAGHIYGWLHTRGIGECSGGRPGVKLCGVALTTGWRATLRCRLVQLRGAPIDHGEVHAHDFVRRLFSTRTLEAHRRSPDAERQQLTRWHACCAGT